MAIIVGLLLSLLCLGSTLLEKSEPINTDLQRLDEISKELTQVASEVKETEIQIANLNEHLSGLKAQETNLNDEATAIFYKMMSPGLIPCNT
jgi:septal ring factor EnvC (AmiA/AmiB activator)